MDVPYALQTTEARNPLARYAHRRRSRIGLAVAEQIAPPASIVLDYGCGPGLFLTELGRKRRDLKLWGYDPYFTDAQLGVRLTADTDDFSDDSVGLVTAFETCEHLDDDELEDFTDLVKRVLLPNGKLLVSVPIIGGPGVLAKELNRLLVHRRRSDYSLPELARAAFLGQPAPRPADVKVSHKGFDFRELRNSLRASLRLEREWYSPIPHVHWGLNSQHFSIWSPRK